jgi:iduronate 2-sulfatase
MCYKMTVKAALLFTLTLLGTAFGTSAQHTAAQPLNVLFIAIDDLNPRLGCYGDAIALTPRMDELAERGTTFVNAHCQWAVCGPTRASLMTSLMPESTGVMGFKKMRGDSVEKSRVNKVADPYVVTLPQYFRYNGYRTAATGKLNDNRCVGTLDTETLKVAEDGGKVDDPPSWGEPVDPNDLPVDFFSNSAYIPAGSGWRPAGKPATGMADLPDADFGDGKICAEGLKLLDQLAQTDEPFFLGVGFKKPHLPFIAPEKYWNLYDRDALPLAAYQELPVDGRKATWFDSHEARTYGGVPKTGPFSEELQRELLHGYYACISFIDAQVGQLLERLDELNLTDNTIVVLWGDHGFHLGDHGQWGKHTNMERAARVPLIITVPGVGTPGIATHPAGFIDIYPTLCELADLDIPEQVQGRSLVPVLEDPEARVRNGIITQFNRKGSGFAYRTDRYRYIEWIKGGAVETRELYDYQEDPEETRNLATNPEHTDLMKELAEQMRADGIGCPTLLKTN